MLKRIFTLLFIVFTLSADAGVFSNEMYPQPDTLKPNRSRLLFITGVNVAGYGGSLVLLNRTWYRNFPKSSFHTFNDSKEWLQMDKIGHAWAAYNTGRITTAMWKYVGLNEKKAVIISGLTSTAYLTVIELMDAHSQKWGWSWSDMGANFFGTGLFMSQQLGWHEQRIQLKFSFHRHYYPDDMTKQRSEELFGDSWAERMLKDYNAQTHWLSFNIRSFFKESKWPAWLNVAVGYGADGMLGGYENVWVDGSVPVIRDDISRKRQFYLSPDIDFTRIKTNKKIGRVVFYVLNILKMPAPALMIDSKGKMRAYAFYF